MRNGLSAPAAALEPAAPVLSAFLQASGARERTPKLQRISRRRTGRMLVPRPRSRNRQLTVLRRRGEATRKGVGTATAVELTLRPGPARAALVEHCYADHADVAVVTSLGGVRILDAAEAEGCHYVLTAPKAVDLDGRPGLHQVAALLERAGLAVDHVQPIHRRNRLEARAGLVLNANGIALPVVAHDVALATGR